MQMLNIVKEYRKTSFSDKIRWLKKITRYIVVRAGGVLAYMGLLICLVELLKINPVVSTAIATPATSLSIYFLSFVWVFNYSGSHSYSLPRFISIEILTFFMNVAIMFFTVNIMGWDYIVGVIGGALIIPLTNFILNFFWAFK